MTTQQFTRTATTNGRVLADQSQLLAAMQAKLDALAAENAALRQSKTRPITFRISDEKGVVSVWGIGSKGVHLYAEQWEKLFPHIEDLKAFIASNPVSKLGTPMSRRNGE